MLEVNLTLDFSGFVPSVDCSVLLSEASSAIPAVVVNMFDVNFVLRLLVFDRRARPLDK